ncbi:MAG TPA: response regulator [Opitutaceae bacterium]|nr:response regulator [Opitutaceae bacterium]
MTAGTPELPVIYSVDDDDIDREFLVRSLAGAGIENPCRTFSSGEELLDALLDVLRGAPAPLAVFVDVKMAGMSGLDVLRWIRVQNDLRGVPVIMLSSSDAPPLLTEAMQFGAQCYAAKFPTAEQLREIVHAAREFSSAAAAAIAFPLRCNLLLEARHAVS